MEQQNIGRQFQCIGNNRSFRYVNFLVRHRFLTYYLKIRKITHTNSRTASYVNELLYLKLVYIIFLAVLAGDYFFVLFGAVNTNEQTPSYTVTNEVRILNVNTWSWISSISALSPETRTPGTGGNGDGSSTVNTGTIVGAVVGGVAGLAIIAGLIAFFLVRKRRNRKLEEEKHKSSSAGMLPNEFECKYPFISIHLCEAPSAPSAFS